METLPYRWAYRGRNVLAGLPLLPALLLMPGGGPHRALNWALGLGLFVLGCSFRIWAQQHLHYRLKMAPHMTASGPYTLLRNPIYVGNTLMCVSMVAAAGLWWLALLALLWCAGIYTLVVRHEEAALRLRYGQLYVDYTAAVPRWMPHRLRGGEMGFVNEHFFRSLLAELHCLLLLLPFVLKEVLSATP